MKKSYLFITTLLVVAAVLVAVVSCKKETHSNLMDSKTETLQVFNPLEIEDMNAYLKGFKQKIQSTVKGDDEALSLEDAAWHLSSLANYEFANANVECDDVRFDTLYAHVNITNGTVLLSDLAEAYQIVSSNIDKFYNNLALDNKHFHFINAFISENGEVTIPLVTTFSHSSKYITDHLWYHDYLWPLILLCDSIFPDSIVYAPSGMGTTALQEELTKVVCHPLNTSDPIYYTKASELDFDYRYCIDLYGSEFSNSRLFNNNYPFLYELSGLDMCYLYDSYLGLGHDHCPPGQVIAIWVLEYAQNQSHTIEFHKLKVIYGVQHVVGEEPGNNNN